VSAPDQERDGGPFTAGTMCPHCCHCDVHPMRVPNPESPKRPTAPFFGINLATARFASGGVVEHYDRWDERPYDVIRICTSCGWEWGQR